MFTETEAIVLHQTKTVQNRRMLTLFTLRYGRIGAGTSATEKGKNKNALMIRPFCYGRYELFKNGDTFNLQSGEVIKSFYGLGGDIDKYLAGSFVLELTDAFLTDEQPQPAIFALLLDFLSLLEKRKSSYNTLVCAYQIKSLSLLGLGLNLGEPGNGGQVSIEDGGLGDINEIEAQMVRFILAKPITVLEELAMNPDDERHLHARLNEFFAYHLGIEKLKSESFSV